MPAEMKRCECGGKPRVTSVKDSFADVAFRYWAVVCTRCMATTEYFDERDEAVEAWNEGELAGVDE